MSMKDGVDAYFFRACESECNGYAQPQVDSMALHVCNCIGL